jgi:hypothetical protein
LCYQIHCQQALDSFVHFEDKTVKFNSTDNAQELLNRILAQWQNSHHQPWLFCTNKLVNAAQIKEIKIITQQNYLKSFIESKQSFPSEGQKYFYSLVKKYDNSGDIEKFLQPIIDAVEYIK